ncbi:hypothetical protein [Snodgrassella sp. CFCC 13594]|uniref:pyridoxamine 5'-phosphate oxidase family protein n=1 Tax=Snodgrassella sp. CFCC 13594 TaxID=1775559 RepID=UPI000833F9EF|nr:hypothetical protein [Snodgrassella sp. CFCC 13594]
MSALSTETLQNQVTTLLTRPGLILATTGTQGAAQASYAPFIFVAEEGALFVLLSGLAPHTQSLQRTGVADVLLLQEEAQVRNVFARARLSYAVTVQPVASDEALHDVVLTAMKAKLGATVDVLRQLPDFVLFRLQPQQGRLILGFGQAYEFTPGRLGQAVWLGVDKPVGVG